MISIAIAEFTQVTFNDQLKIHFHLFIIQSWLDIDNFRNRHKKKYRFIYL
jgi:hypothetical protein